MGYHFECTLKDDVNNLYDKTILNEVEKMENVLT